MRYLLIALLALAACSQIHAGPSYIDRGYQFEVSAFKVKETGTPIGIRASAGQLKLPDKWADIYGDWTARYALGPFVDIPLWEKTIPYAHTSSSYTTGIYIEPRIEAAYYPDLGTPFEPEAGLRLIYRYDFFEVFFGARLPLGNGNDHERMGEYEHIYFGAKPEFGISWDFDF